MSMVLIGNVSIPEKEITMQDRAIDDLNGCIYCHQTCIDPKNMCGTEGVESSMNGIAFVMERISVPQPPFEMDLPPK